MTFNSLVEVLYYVIRYKVTRLHVFCPQMHDAFCCEVNKAQVYLMLLGST